MHTLVLKLNNPRQSYGLLRKLPEQLILTKNCKVIALLFVKFEGVSLFAKIKSKHII